MRNSLLCLAALFALAACGPAGRTYGDIGATTTTALQQSWFAGGAWKLCLAAACPTSSSGSGAAALTFAAYFGWQPQNKSAGDPSYGPLMDKIVQHIPIFNHPCVDAGCHINSDVPMWNAVAMVRSYNKEDTGNPGLSAAVIVLRTFDRSRAYYTGACPEIAYLEPFGGKSKLKALATESNYVKASINVAQLSSDNSYLDKAEHHYLAARKYFFDPKAGLYTGYVIDDGQHCRQVPRRFLAGVNGNMIYSAFALDQLRKGDPAYSQQANAVAHAAVKELSDARGILANLQDEDDTADPLFEAMYVIAYYWNQDFARSWIVRNAAAADAARTKDGSVGRFLDGPPPEDGVSAWQTSGGFAATLAAKALEPYEVPSPDPGWSHAGFKPLKAQKTPLVIRFTGRGIALRGTLGDPCCPSGARVFVDGVETFDHTGIRQSYSPAGKFPNAVLFAWQWPASGKHEIKIEARAPADAARAVHLSGYEVK